MSERLGPTEKELKPKSSINEVYSTAVKFATEADVYTESGTRVVAGKHPREGLIVVRYDTNIRWHYTDGDLVTIFYNGTSNDILKINNPDSSVAFKREEDNDPMGHPLRLVTYMSYAKNDDRDRDEFGRMKEVLTQTKPDPELTKKLVKKLGTLRKKVKEHELYFR